MPQNTKENWDFQYTLIWYDKKTTKICSVIKLDDSKIFTASTTPPALAKHLATLKLGTHYPCTRAVFTPRVHGPFTGSVYRA